MSLTQGFPSTFSTTQTTIDVLHNLDNETKKIYNDVNAIMAADGHSHTGNGSDGALLDFSNPTTATHQPNPVSITSATGVLTLLETSNSFIAGGTEPITSIAGWTKGVAYIRWNTARTLTYDATTFILQNAVDRVTTIGDIGVYEITSAGAREIGYFPVALRMVYPVQVRQTVLSGAVDTTGQANQLQIGTGLTVNELATSVPTVTTWANGFDTSGAIDYVQMLTTTATSAWSNLTTNSTLFLYKERNATTGAVTYGFTTLQPIYQIFVPSAPTTNQYWFDPSAMLGCYYNGSEWIAVQRVFVGECVTGASAVTSVTSYALSGRYNRIVSVPNLNTLTIYNHNIGIDKVSLSMSLKNITAEYGYSVGDEIANVISADSTNNLYSMPLSFNKNNIYITQSDRQYRVISKSSPGSSVIITQSNWNIRLHGSRGW